MREQGKKVTGSRFVTCEEESDNVGSGHEVQVRLDLVVPVEAAGWHMKIFRAGT